MDAVYNCEEVNFRADDMACGDIDQDGDPDMVVTVDEDGKVFWYENPGPHGDPRTAAWKAHPVGQSAGYIKDVEVADLDKDSKPEIVTRIHEVVSILRQIGMDSWSKIAVPIHPKEGMHVGDLDNDGDLDIALNGFWLETPADLMAAQWKEHIIDNKWFTQ